MTPEHADTLINDYVMPLPESCGRFIPAIRQAIIAACAEERRAALAGARRECAARIEALRDKP